MEISRERLTVVDHVRQDHEYMEVVGERKEFCNRKGAPWGGKPLDSRVIGKVHEKNHAFERPGPFEIPHEE